MKKIINIRFLIAAAIILLGILNLFFPSLLHIVFPKKEYPIEVRVKDLIYNFTINKEKYNKTVVLLEEIDNPNVIRLSPFASGTKERNYWLNVGDIRLNNKYPFFASEMKKIWEGKFIGALFDQNSINFGIYGDLSSAELIYTKLQEELFLQKFIDTMEFCVYPQIPKSSEHWIVKLEDKWYLYDGYFKFDNE